MKFSTLLVSLLALLLTGCAAVSLEDIERAKAEGTPILVSKLNISHPNSAGGVDVHVNFLNTSEKTLKYAVFTVLPYNKVGDVAPSEIGRKTFARLKDTGPVQPEQWSVNSYWSNTWYNHSIRCVELTRIDLTYMTGSTESIGGVKLSQALASSIDNTCVVQ
mgnify:CR=1 FL=1|tara:strand:- start:142 stop:627 length:486 start_codon:yes stop_codon:yes gene_type:complete